MTPCRSFSTSKPTTSWIWVSNPTSGESSEARSAKPVRVGAYTSWPAASKKGMTFCQHHPPCQPPCTSTNVAMLASFFTDGIWYHVRPDWCHVLTGKSVSNQGCWSRYDNYRDR